MSTLLERADQAVSVTTVSRSAKDIFEKLRNGQQSRFVVMKNNEPAAVMLSVEAFQALQDELDDLRVDALARERLRTLDRREILTHREMMRRFAKPGVE